MSDTPEVTTTDAAVTPTAPSDATPAAEGAAPPSTEQQPPPETKEPEVKVIDLARRARAIEKRAKDIEAREKQLAEQAQALDSLKAQAKSDPAAAAAAIGLDVEQLLEALVGVKREPTAEEQIQKLVDARLEAAEKTRQEAEQAKSKQDAERAYARELETIQATAKRDAAKYPLLTRRQAYQDALETMAILHQRGIATSHDDALARVEAVLRDEWEADHRLLKPAPQGESPQATPTNQARSLSNSLTGEVAANPGGHVKSDAEIRAEWLKQFGRM